jgi:hypothetical protein
VLQLYIRHNYYFLCDYDCFFCKFFPAIFYLNDRHYAFKMAVATSNSIEVKSPQAGHYKTIYVHTNDCLCCTSSEKISHSYGDVTISSEELRNESPFTTCKSYWGPILTQSLQITFLFLQSYFWLLFCLIKLNYTNFFVSLFVRLFTALPEQFFSYPAAFSINGNRSANLDLCLAICLFCSEGSFKCHTYCDMRPPF